MSKVAITDKNGKVLEEEEFITALKKGLIRKVVRIFIFNSKGELFQQKRSDNVFLFPGKWDSSASGHVDHADEKVLDSAKREVEEELGITNLDLKEEVSFYNDEGIHDNMVLKCFETIFSATYDGKLNLENWEVSEGRWIKKEELDKEIKQFPKNFSEGFVNSWKKYKEKNNVSRKHLNKKKTSHQ